jgi:hypothetical protein
MKRVQVSWGLAIFIITLLIVALVTACGGLPLALPANEDATRRSNISPPPPPQL